MTITDPISDMLIRIKNAVIVEKPSVSFPSSKIKMAILKVLKEEGYIENFVETEKNKKKTVEVILRYNAKKQPFILDVKRISKPSKRVYKEVQELNTKKQTTTVLSTSKGIMTAKAAKKQNLGGEALFEIF
jgi:small subunit ribosomal protein S8